MIPLMPLWRSLQFAHPHECLGMTHGMSGPGRGMFLGKNSLYAWMTAL